MASIKELLGDKYVEDMTIADIDKILSGLKLADLSTGDYVSKGKLTDAEKKYKDLEKMYNDKLTDEEKLAKEQAEKDNRYKELEAELSKMKYKQELSKTIDNEDVINNIAELLANGDLAGAVAKQTEYFTQAKEDWTKKVKEDLARSNPNPHPHNQGGEITQEQFNGMGYSDRVNLLNENPDLYNKLNS